MTTQKYSNQKTVASLAVVAGLLLVVDLIAVSWYLLWQH